MPTPHVLLTLTHSINPPDSSHIEAFEKLLLKRIRNDIVLSTFIPNYEFGLRNGHCTIQQTHGIENKIVTSLEEKHCVQQFSST
jgi:hypothetical protein